MIIMEVKDITPKERPQWCPGCGNFGILGAIKNAIVKSGAKKEQTVVVSGIGCSGKISHYINTYGFEGLHGRALPVATGVKLANKDLTVIAMGGDGDGYGIGMGHFMHIMRRNIDLTYVVHDNQIYGLTTGQASPTTEKGIKTKTTPYGNIEEPVHPMEVAIAAGASFVARTFAGDIAHMVSVMTEAIKHKGFAHIDVLQPCVSFNKHNTYDWYRQRVYKIEKTPETKEQAIELAMEPRRTNFEKIPIGILWKEQRPTYLDGRGLEKPLIKTELKRDISEDLKALM